MPDTRKQEYYQKNRNKRLDYQHEYYHENKERIKRLREIKMESDPDWVEKQRRYNRKYYDKNKKQIRARREYLRKQREKSAGAA